MKKCLQLLLLLCATTVFPQAFEGKITYKNEIKSNSAQVTDKQWTDMMGTTQEYYIKGGDYKSVANGQLMQWQLYINADNKLYSKMANLEAVLYNDAAVQGDEVLKAETKKNVVKILGYDCDEITLTCRSGVQKYYYNAKLGIDASKFVNHKIGNWHDFVSRSNALPLKMIIENTQFTLTSTAVEVKPAKTEAGMFKLPPGIAVQRSPY